jgi:hypothetical protein
MKVSNAVVGALIALCTLQGALLASRWLPPTMAFAQDSPAPTLEAASVFPGRLLCRTFPADPTGPAVLMPGDKSDVGGWVAEQDDTWQIYTVDFEMGTKSTGFPQGWVQVCLAPR